MRAESSERCPAECLARELRAWRAARGAVLGAGVSHYCLFLATTSSRPRPMLGLWEERNRNRRYIDWRP